MKCENCKFFKKSLSHIKSGYCYFNPPVIIYQHNNMDRYNKEDKLLYERPIVYACEFCSNFIEKETKNVKE